MNDAKTDDDLIDLMPFCESPSDPSIRYKLTSSWGIGSHVYASDGVIGLCVELSRAKPFGDDDGKRPKIAQLLESIPSGLEWHPLVYVDGPSEDCNAWWEALRKCDECDGDGMHNCDCDCCDRDCDSCYGSGSHKDKIAEATEDVQVGEWFFGRYYLWQIARLPECEISAVETVEDAGIGKPCLWFRFRGGLGLLVGGKK